MASIDVSYNKIHPIHVVLDAGSAYNVIILDELPLA